MSKWLKIALIVVGALAAVAILVGGGMMIGRSISNREINGFGGMMGSFNGRNNPRQAPRQPNRKDQTNNGRPGMMGSFTTYKYSGTPITVDNARQAAENYLKTLDNSDLVVKEVMVFNNNAYVAVVETSTGKGAMELLVDPATQAVRSEMGPNMMWNLKYNPVGTGNCTGSGGMMGRQSNNSSGVCGLAQSGTTAATDLTVTPQQAILDAQAYLDKNIPGTQAAADPMAFYGYYTLDYSKDGKPVGMLSVNGYSGQIWLHTWHDTFIEEWQAK